MVIIRKKQKETPEEKEVRIQKEKEAALGLQDQYQARGFELVSWMQHHRIVVGISIALLVLGGALVSAYLYYVQRRTEMASSAYISAVASIDEFGDDNGEEEGADKKKIAQEKLADIANSYKGMDIAMLSGIRSGHLALEMGDAKKAVELYQNSLDNIKKTDPLFPVAMLGLAFSQEASGDKSRAIESFTAIIDLRGDVGRDLALWEAARLSRDTNDMEKAKDFATKLLDEYPNSIYEKDARRIREGS